MVDDEPTVLFTFQAILEQQDYEVVGASSYREAAEQLRQRKFDAVIADLNLEREGIGLQVARAAKSLQPPPAVVIFTGYPTVDQLQKAFDLHVDYLALKPVDVEEIKSALHKLVTRRADALSLACA
jgi:two-component system response regulator PilR (NtrC family)